MRIEVQIQKMLRSSGREFHLDVEFTCLDDVSVVFGASGSGKSATLRAIAGLDRPDSGRIVVDGRVLFDSARGIDVPARMRSVGYLFQDYALFPHLTVEDNVAFPVNPWWRRRPAREVAKRIRDLMDIFEIGSVAQSYPWQISGGQRQRVGLARTLIRKPAVLLLDEPFAALDPLLRIRMRQELLNTQWLFKVPMLAITHDPEDVSVLAETVVVLNQGRVEKTVDVKTAPYRDGDGRVSEGSIRELLMGIDKAGPPLLRRKTICAVK
ncbi:MAG TPA: ATP-binding cassette domain-containing protein [Terriglobia bacterium]|nr:ATP-binding cassette domain-containing protein [Terriglobia bacterium]